MPWDESLSPKGRKGRGKRREALVKASDGWLSPAETLSLTLKELEYSVTAYCCLQVNYSYRGNFRFRGSVSSGMSCKSEVLCGHPEALNVLILPKFRENFTNNIEEAIYLLRYKPLCHLSYVNFTMSYAFFSLLHLT